jgi:hypothetical protein
MEEKMRRKATGVPSCDPTKTNSSVFSANIIIIFVAVL